MWQVEVTFSERRFPYTELTLTTGMSVLSMTNLDSAVFVRQGFGSSSWPTPVTAVGHEALRLTYVLHVDCCLLWGGKFRKASTAYWWITQPRSHSLLALSGKRRSFARFDLAFFIMDLSQAGSPMVAWPNQSCWHAKLQSHSRTRHFARPMKMQIRLDPMAWPLGWTTFLILTMSIYFYRFLFSIYF